MKSIILACVTVASALLIASSASATVVASQSFESPVLNTPGIQYGPDEFSFNTNETGPVAITDFTFIGFSGIISNTSLGVFPNAPLGTQAAFLQSYLGGGSEIDWAFTGLTPGQTYQLSFEDVGAQVVPYESFTVSAFGATPVNFTPTGAYTTHILTFVPSTASGSIDFVGAVAGPTDNHATAIDNLVLSAVPEASAWVLMIAGFGVAGAAMRSLRRRETFAA